MATLLSTSLYTELEQSPRLFAALAERFLERGQLQKVKKQHRFAHYKAEELKIKASGKHLACLAASVLHSDQALELYTVYTLLSGRQIWLDLHFYGSDYQDKWKVFSDGHIRLIISYHELARPFRAYIRQDGNGYDKQLSQEGIELARSALQDAEEIFLRACNLPNGNDDGYVSHGAMYLETGWPSPVGAAMLYHRDWGELTKDFSRIYKQYHMGLGVPEMFACTRLQSQYDSFREPGRNNPSYYQQFVEPYPGDILAFLSELSEEKVMKLSQIPAQQMREALNTISDEVPEVNYYDLDRKGFVLAANPLSSVWRVYEYLAILFE